MSNNPIHVRVEPHIHDMIDHEVSALGIKGGRGLAGGKAEWVRRIVYEHFDQPLPKQSHYLPGVTVSKHVSKQAKGMKRNGPPQPKSTKKDRVPAFERAQESAVKTGSIIDDPRKNDPLTPEEMERAKDWHTKRLARQGDPLARAQLGIKTVRPIDPAPAPDDVPGQVLIDGSEVNSPAAPEPPARTITTSISDPVTAKIVGLFLIKRWDGKQASQWSQMPGLLRDHFGTDFGLTDLACRARYRRAKAAQQKNQ